MKYIKIFLKLKSKFFKSFFNLCEICKISRNLWNFEKSVKFWGIWEIFRNLRNSEKSEKFENFWEIWEILRNLRNLRNVFLMVHSLPRVENPSVINSLQLQWILVFIVLGTDHSLLSSDGAVGETSNDDDIVGWKTKTKNCILEKLIVFKKNYLCRDPYKKLSCSEHDLQIMHHDLMELT